MNGRVIALGDVHGCVHALDAVLERIRVQAEDTLVFLGDVIDFGHESAAVLDRMLKLQWQCRVVLIRGNHEQMFLEALKSEEAFESWMMFGGYDTLTSYRFGAKLSEVPAEHVAVIEASLPYFETESHIFVHANYDPELPLSEQPEYLLRWTLLEDPYPGPHDSGRKVVVGHTEQRNGEILDLGHVVCIDTYCRGYGWLTAMDVNSGTIWQASRFGAMREGEPVEPLRQLKGTMEELSFSDQGVG